MNLRAFYAFVCLGAGLGSLSCSVETKEEPASDAATVAEKREEATRILGVHGMDTSTLEFMGQDKVIVEGDMVMSLDAILDVGARQVEKGYFHELFLWASEAPASNVGLVLEDDLPTAWKTAFRAAAAEWTKISGIDIREGGSNSSMIIVEWVGFLTGFPPLPDTGTFARGYYPPWTLGIIGNIEVNANYGGSCFTGASAAGRRQKTAMHEIGHTLGFTHPEDGFLIPGTESGDDYATTMAQGCFSRTTLSSDDIDSANFFY